jgi:hypothetical protein
MLSSRWKRTVYVVLIVLALVALIAIPVWRGTGPVVLAPGIDP